MCLIVFGINVHDEFPFIMVANRDEFFNRPTLPLHNWKDHDVVGGRDLKANGTWLGVNKNGKIAAITNFRDPKNLKDDAPSRGMLTTNFLVSNDSIDDYLEFISKDSDQYNGFNLLLGDENKITHFSNVTNKKTEIRNGVHGLSNALLDTPWPKVTSAKEKLNKALLSNQLDDEFLINILRDKSEAKPGELPNTGVSKEVESKLSSMFIRMPGYGTRCTSVIKKDRFGTIYFTEFAYNEDEDVIHKNRLTIKITEN